MSNPIFRSEEDYIAISYFSRLTNTVGAVGIGIAISILQFNNPTPIAWFLFFVFSIWTWQQGGEYRKLLNTTEKKYQPSVFLFIKHGWLSIISISLFAFIASGILNNNIIN